MRLLLGMILGSLLTIGGAYVADQQESSAEPHPMVNWDVVEQKLAVLTADAPDRQQRPQNHAEQSAHAALK